MLCFYNFTKWFLNVIHLVIFSYYIINNSTVIVLHILDTNNSIDCLLCTGYVSGKLLSIFSSFYIKTIRQKHLSILCGSLCLCIDDYVHKYT